MTVGQVVERERSRVRRLHVGRGIALAIAATATLVGVSAAALGDARWLTLPRSLPVLVWLVVLAVNAAAVVWTVRRLRLSVTPLEVARAIEEEQSLRAGQLRGAMEVANEGPLGRRAAESLGARLGRGGATLAPQLQRRARHGVVRALTAAVVTAAALLGIVAPVFDDGLLALLRPVSAWKGTLLPRLGFVDLPSVVVRNEPLRIHVRAPGRATVTLHVRSPGEGWRTMPLRPDDSAGLALASLGPVTGDLTLVVDDGRTRSDTALVRVTDRPFVGGVSLRAIYPAYLARAAEGLAVGEPARVPVGTIIEVRGRASTSLTAVRLASAIDTLTLAARGHAFSGRIEARRSGRFQWIASGRSGLVADVPAPLELNVVPDSAPRVELLSPERDTVVVADASIPLRATASDDHGIRGVEIVSWRVTSTGMRHPVVRQGVAAGASTAWAGDGTLDLAVRELQPGDALHARVVATDNSPWSQRGESRELVLRIPTLEERRSLARTAGDSLVERARELAQSQRSLSQRTDDASRERADRSATGSRTDRSERSGAQGATGAEDKAKAMSFQAAEKAAGIAKEQRALADKTQELRKAAQALEQQLRAAGALDSALARQLRDVQQLLKEAMTPALMEQMRKLEEASKQLSGDDARQAMRDLAEQQRKLREQIEKSAEMLKRAALEGSMQTLHDEAKEVAAKERRLADSARTREAAGAEAKQLAERSKRLADDVSKLEKRLQQEQAQKGAQQTDEARRRAEASERAMRQAAQSMQEKGNAGDGAEQPQSEPSAKARASAGEAAEQMERAAQAMKSARDAQVAEWKQELTAELDRSIQELLQMAREETSLERRARAGQSNAEQLRGAQSSVQQGVEQTGQRLDQAGKKSSLLSGRSQRAVGEAQQKVKQAVQQLAQDRSGNGQGSAAALGEAADALNRAAASLARDREKANAASSASGFAEMMQQLQELAQKQGGINGQAQGLMSMPGGPMSPGAQGTARALARQQRGVAEQLDELSENAAGARAGELAKEARQLAETLDGGRIDAGTLARQQQLFRRLLDAGRSLEKEEREDDAKREARAATGENAFTPGATDVNGRPISRFREPSWAELRGLTADERRAVLDYFRRLNAQKP